MRIVFIGAVEFSLKALERLIIEKANIVGVCTKEESKFNSDYADLTPICKANNIPSKFIDDINSSENINWITSLKPDIIFCFGWSFLLKKELIKLPKMGVVGYHPAALPQNRGRHPLIWALVLGLKRSASTFFFMQEGTDDGDILSQTEFEISNEDDARTLYDKVINISLEQIKSFLPALQTKNYLRIPQEHSLSNQWRKRAKVDGIIDFRMSSEAIFNLVRGLTKPYPGAHISYNNEDVKIWKVETVQNNQANIEFGKILEIKGNTILVKTYDSAIRILDHDFKTLPSTGEYL